MSNSEIGSLLKRGVTEVIIESELTKLLESGKPLRLKQGFDPSCPDIHLGHTVGLRKLRQFQDMGHQLILIVGDWTAQIGDPSGRSVMRPMLTAEEVKANAQTYMEQFFKVVDEKKTEVRWQSEWYGTFGLADVIKLTSKFTVAQMLAREDFSNRYTGGHPIAITELLYPLLQAYDSVVIEADVEFGGIDQKFNCLLGRELQEMVGQTPQQLVFVPLLVGTDGTKKMSKSLGNYIGVDESPKDIFGKTMSIPDELIIDYFTLLTDVPDEELEEFKKQMDSQSVNPMELKKRLGREIVTQFHNAGAAKEAEEDFTRVVQRKEVPDEMLEVSLRELQALLLQQQNEAAEDPNISDDDLIELLTPSLLGTGCIAVSMALLLTNKGLVKSRSEAKRLITQGAIQIIHIDESKTIVYDDRPFIQAGDKIKVGKRRFLKIVD